MKNDDDDDDDDEDDVVVEDTAHNADLCIETNNNK